MKLLKKLARLVKNLYRKTKKRVKDMAFGFNVADSSGVTILDDKYFTVVGEEISVPAGDLTIARYPTVVGVSVKGSELSEFGVLYAGVPGISDEITIRSSKPCIATVYRNKERALPSGDFGIEVYSGAGLITFSSSDKPLSIEKMVNINLSTYQEWTYSEPINLEKEYMLTEASWSFQPINPNIARLVHPVLVRSGSSLIVRAGVYGQTQQWQIYSMKNTCKLLVLSGH